MINKASSNQVDHFCFLKKEGITVSVSEAWTKNETFLFCFISASIAKGRYGIGISLREDIEPSNLISLTILSKPKINRIDGSSPYLYKDTFF
jgi:hypothetical protein